MRTFKTFYYDDICEQLMESDHMSEIQKIVSASVNGNIEELAKKLKAWAIEHMNIAAKTGDTLDLMKKIVNNPEGIAKQLVAALMAKQKPLPVLTKTA